LKAIVIVLLLVKPVYADERKIADVISYGTVATQITLNTIYNWKQTDRKKAIVKEVVTNVLIIASSETIKVIVHEDRPDHSDRKSFWSEHTALAAGNMGYCYSVGFSLTLGTATGRIVAKKHHWWDTLVGAGVGMAVDQFIK
jgi:membrane-associated phospholipid phosphatase